MKTELSWQSWETRPKDGTFFIAACSDGTVTAGNEPDGYFFGSWIRYPHFNGQWSGMATLCKEPIAWMPLPKLPENFK